MFLQEARRAGSGGQGQSQWRKVLPSIRDVQVNLLTPGTAFITFKGNCAFRPYVHVAMFSYPVAF